FPSKRELEQLRREVAAEETDVMPARGSEDFYAIRGWRPEAGDDLVLSVPYRIERALRFVDTSEEACAAAIERINEEVALIETCAAKEHETGDLHSNWRATGKDQDCVTCDFKHFCPSPAGLRGDGEVGKRRIPVAPG